MRPVRTLGAVMALVAALATGCGGGTDSSDEARSGANKPVTVQAANGAVTIPSKPERIVSLAPVHTETLFAIGAGPQVVAVDDYSDYPAEAPRTKLSGFKPNAEAVIEYKPDLVIVSDDLNGIVKALEKVKIPVLLEPAANNLEEAYDEIRDLGLATGHSDEAEKLVAEMKSSIEKTVAETPKAKGLTYFHELDNELYTVTSKTFVGQIYGMFGLRNVADEAEGANSGYPRLSREYLLKQDPDLIFLADTKCCGQNAETVAKRPGWSDLTAVKNGAVIELDDAVSSRWGPRLPEFVKEIGAAVQKAQ